MKRNISLRQCLAACLLALPLMAGAQVQPISIDSCRTLALQYNKDRQSAALTTQQAELTRRSTRALFLPDFSLTGFALYDTASGSMGLGELGFSLPAELVQVFAQMAPQAMSALAELANKKVDYKVGAVFSGGLLLKQPLYMGGKIRAAYAMSQTAVEMARQKERLTDAEVLQKVDEAYAQVVKAEELLEVAMRYDELLAELDSNVAAAVRHGLRHESERTKVQVKINEVAVQKLRAQNGVRLAKMNLCHLTGQPLLTDIEVYCQYPEVEEALLLQTMDISQRPELALLEGQAELARQQAKMTRSALLPQVALLAKYGYTYGAELNDHTLLDGPSFAGGVTVNVPLYHFGERTNKLKAARVKAQQMQLERDNKAELVLLELTQAANQVEEAQLETQLCHKSLQQAEQNMTLSRQHYDAGLEPLSNYLEAQAQWQQAHESEVDAHFRLYLASVAYLKAAGKLF